MRILLIVVTVFALAGLWSAASAAVSVSFSPDTLDFGEIRVGETDSLRFTLTNTGSDSLTEILSARGFAFVVASFDPATISLAPGGSVEVTMRISMLIGNVSIRGIVLFFKGGYESIDIIGPIYKARSVFSGLYWQPDQFYRSLHEYKLNVSGSRVAGFQGADLRIEPDNGFTLRWILETPDSVSIGVTVAQTAPEGIYKVKFERNSTTVDSLHIQVLKSFPRVEPFGTWPLADTLYFSAQKNVDTLTLRGQDFWPGCRFEFADSGLTVQSTDLFADSLAILGVRLEPGATLNSTSLRAINPDSGYSLIPKNVYIDITDLPVSVKPETLTPGTSLPRAFALGANYPNPFNPSTTITYRVPEGPPTRVSLKVYNLRGQLVSTLVDSPRPPGEYSVVWNGTDNAGLRLPSGVYLYRISAGAFHCTRKMVLLK